LAEIVRQSGHRGHFGVKDYEVQRIITKGSQRALIMQVLIYAEKPVDHKITLGVVFPSVLLGGD
jgi:hypothetical protein